MSPDKNVEQPCHPRKRTVKTAVMKAFLVLTFIAIFSIAKISIGTSDNNGLHGVRGPGEELLAPGSNSRHLLFSARLISDPSRHSNANKHVTMANQNHDSDNDKDEISDVQHGNASKCTHPAYHEFPTDAFTNHQRQSGALVLHVILAVYMFAALAVVCDEFFVASLDKISENLNLSSDVAGATFMAAGSSAPELFTSMIGVFVAKGDVGVGTIVGSAVFNILFVIGVCGLVTTQVVMLKWFPLVRDSSFYSISVVLLIISIADGYVQWYESAVMLLFYVFYIVCMRFNADIQMWAESKVTWFGIESREDVEQIVTPDTEKPCYNTYDIKDMENLDANSQDCVQDEFNSKTNWKQIPEMDKGLLAVVEWATMLPVQAVLHCTIPDCSDKRWQKWYLVTFMMSIFWIAAFSYLMVWMVSVIGFTIGVPDAVMGITFLAAGTSVPDCMASMIVARNGQGDMAISNTIGSNVFDILIGLSLPWFIQTAIVNTGSTVPINSNGLIFSVILLFLTVIITIVSVHKCGWRLDRRLAYICLSSYAVFLFFSILIEFNVFGYVNAPMCTE